MPSSNTFPPKFSQDILYPAELNLDEIDFSSAQNYNPETKTGIIGDIGLGNYFDIEFPGYSPNTIPTLAYGKHSFTISIVPNPGGMESTFPILRQNSRILFEVKDSLDPTGKRRVIFSDVTPIYSSDVLKFMAYMWIKEDPLRTYEPIQEGTGYITIVGLTETRDTFWQNRYNVRSQLPINIDTTTLVTNEDNTSQYYYNENTSPIIFKTPNKMVSGSGFICGEKLNDNIVGDERSFLIITGSNLETYSGRVHNIKTQFWLSGSDDNSWKDLKNASHNLAGTDFEENIHIDYSTGINPNIEMWVHEIDEGDIPHGGTENKVKFRFRFYDILTNTAISILPISGSDSTITEFKIDYPTGDPESSTYTDSDDQWLTFEGSGVYLTGTTVFNSNNSLLLTTSAGQFDFGIRGRGIISSTLGLKYNASGEPSIPEDQFPGGDPTP